ncbi:MAG: alanine--tRNA ligase [Proteobacteria bacterium]|nr:alanine--tRNA ligase [Pseudomonadota bacterium]
MKNLSDIRAGFLKYFERHGHAIVESSPLVPRNDPTLMFTNSGMVQFKNVFTGVEQRPYKRATTAQKSVRAGGKHNDLENVGYTARHHTFFEMLGNFSFGDYFKDDAIAFAWELVTKDYGLPKDKLLVTVYHEDDQAATLWKKVAGFHDSKIIRIKTDANFWRMGNTGPCGPCSEIFIDQGDRLQGGPPGSPDEDGDRFLEFWNLVFMQFEELEGGKRVNLPKPSVDTGMGLERMTAIMQGVYSNYDIDLFQSIISATADLVSVNPGGSQKPSFRVIADHLRASAFLLADGVMPGNEGRGYVLRRIMRRAMRHAHLLGAREPLMHQLVPELVKLMGAVYPELGRAQALITETLKLEEARFKQTLERGLKLLDEETAKLPKRGALAGEVAFKLYDTFGFPLDLTQDVLRGRGLKVDQAGFDTAMTRQKQEARKSWSGSGEAATSKLWFELRDEVGATEFLGYATEMAEGQVKALVVDGKKVSEAKAGQKVAVVVNQTPFYGESGGQIGDKGMITVGKDVRLMVSDVQKEAGDVFAHLATVEKGTLKVGDSVFMEVDHTRRTATRANHSATHLLNEALRRTLGEHVSQKGSAVGPEHLRFDFSHPYALKDEEILKVEDIVNERIRANQETITRVLTPDEAIKEGAIAMFGEKYGEEVRVLSIGGVEDGKQRPFSMELCGGTHVYRTGDIGMFKLVSEGTVASGVRRIEAVTGQGALAYARKQEKLAQEVAHALRASPAEAVARATALVEERKKLEREVSELRRQLATGGGGSANDEVSSKNIGNIRFASRVLQDLPAKDLKPMADALKAKLGSGVVALAGVFEGKVSLVVGVTDDLTSRVNAVDLARTGAEALGGKGGGGRPDMAQAGGTDPAKVQEALAAIEQALTRSSKAA